MSPEGQAEVPGLREVRDVVHAHVVRGEAPRGGPVAPAPAPGGGVTCTPSPLLDGDVREAASRAGAREAVASSSDERTWSAPHLCPAESSPRLARRTRSREPGARAVERRDDHRASLVRQARQAPHEPRRRARARSPPAPAPRPTTRRSARSVSPRRRREVIFPTSAGSTRDVRLRDRDVRGGGVHGDVGARRRQRWARMPPRPHVEQAQAREGARGVPRRRPRFSEPRKIAA